MSTAVRPYSLLRRLAFLAAAIAVLIGGAVVIAKATIDHLLYHDATIAARNWASYLARNVHDLPEIVAGQPPSEESRRFAERAQKVGQVFRYQIFDRQGRFRFGSAETRVGGLAETDNDDDETDADGLNPNAAQAIAAAQPIVFAKEGDAPGWPSFYAEAYVPVTIDGQTLGVMEAYVDQAEERDVFRGTFATASASMALLIALAFGGPAFAWMKRTREKQRAEAQIDYLSRHNAMTGLPNREALSQALAEALAALPDQRSSLAIHHVGIDRLKDINDTFGHKIGDELIRTTAKRLCEIDGGHFVSHLGGDAFAVVQTDLGSSAEAEHLARRFTDAAAKRVVLHGQEIATSVSIGIALAPAHGSEPALLMKCADIALHKAKTHGPGSVQLFAPEFDSELKSRLRLEKLIRDAAHDDGFELYYQPTVIVPSGRLAGFEALLRLRGADGAAVSPAQFIPVAEQIGLIEKIGTWALGEACRAAAAWPSHLKVAVNLSPAQFRSADLSRTVAAALAEASLEPSRLELEITEGLLLSDTQAVMTELRRLKALGVAIVMDDFGTGYSSLSYLWRFPFDKIKIDRAFMLAMDANDRGEAETIVRTIIALGKSLRMTVTVEGVEDARQVAFVHDAAGDQIQGFFFGRPMPVTDLAGRIMADARLVVGGPEAGAQALAAISNAG